MGESVDTIIDGCNVSASFSDSPIASGITAHSIKQPIIALGWEMKELNIRNKSTVNMCLQHQLFESLTDTRSSIFHFMESKYHVPCVCRSFSIHTLELLYPPPAPLLPKLSHSHMRVSEPSN